MKLTAIVLYLLLIISCAAEAQAFGLPPISVDQDTDLLTNTPIPLRRLTSTPTVTATSTMTFTNTPTVTPTATAWISVPTMTQTVVLPNSEAYKRAHDQGSQIGQFDEKFFFEVALGLDMPVQGWQSNYKSGDGGKAGLGILFKDGLAIELDLEYFGSSSAGATGAISQDEVLILPTMRRYLFSGTVRPYFSIGNGLAIETSTAGLQSETVNGFDLALGAGVEFQFEDSFSTFIEGKYNLVFLAASPTEDIPIVVGARLGL